MPPRAPKKIATPSRMVMRALSHELNRFARSQPLNPTVNARGRRSGAEALGERRHGPLTFP